uniref:Uncharacterized protein n=1 Tax=Heterorhabditis bacteriophora TaxID=37862 RepID=A0A1I7WAU7_HETBA
MNDFTKYTYSMRPTVDKQLFHLHSRLSCYLSTDFLFYYCIT